jgi:hypothetical protein
VGNSLADKLNVSNYLTEAQRAELVLPDPLMQVSHPLYKKLNFSNRASDIAVAVSALVLFTRPLFLGRNCVTVVRRILIVLGTMYLLRAFTVSLTVLPNPFVECHSEREDNVLYNAALVITSQRVTCGDVFFSGHTIIFTLSLCTWLTYAPRRFTILKFLATVFNVWSMWILVAAKFHYTIDVLISFLLTSSLWHFYHFAVKSEELQQYWWCRMLKRLDDPFYHYKRGEWESVNVAEDANDWDSEGSIEIVIDAEDPHSLDSPEMSPSGSVEKKRFSAP